MENASKGGRAATVRRGSGRSRHRGLWWLGTAAAIAVACDRPEYTYAPDVPLGATAGTSFGSGGTGPVVSGGSSAVFPIGATGGTSVGPVAGACSLDEPAQKLSFSDQTVNDQVPARRVVYLQMTDAEVEALKKTGALLAAPTPSAPASTLKTLLTSLLNNAPEARRPLLAELANRFQVTRAAWPNPWALRLVDHPSSQRLRAVRLTLKEDAWIVRLSDTTPAILDVNNAIVSLAAATAAPERIAAIYYVVDDASPGAVATCETGKRELALGNPDMVESFEVGTPDVLARLDSDLAALEALFEVTRSCASVDRNGTTFHAFTVCQSWRFFDASTEFLAYQWSLANPVEAYKPSAQNLATLIQALRDDRGDLEPFSGTPAVGAGSAGASGGANEVGGEGGAFSGGAGGAGGEDPSGALGGVGGNPN